MEKAIFLKNEHQPVSQELYFDFCGFSKTLPFHSFGPAIRQDYILHIVMEGKGIYRVKNQQYHLKKGDLFLIRPGDSTFYLADGEDPWVYCWISFGGVVADKIIQHSLFKEDQYTMVSSEISKYVSIILACMNYSPKNLADELQLNALTYQLLALLLEDGGYIRLGEQKNYSALAVATVQYIEEHYAQQLTVEEIAQHLAVNRSHLSRVFKNHLGISIKEYMIGVRINRAAFLLSLTEDSVENIAYQVGFNSLVVFSRMFKKFTGETATSYRKRMNNEVVGEVSTEELKKQLEKQAIVSWAT
ncbi:AraC-like ligand binding domain-containing protein [Enterococcus sp. 10A9_DIV0425]|uniref:AraC-like ligand binding domain-containing protein n=1 Tax=Candidatus Enterococcus wittei TaxID=1987383 RepID=A0A242K1H9_9ENTE|nr:AraC family transcriptional regulator [Enterococcus sp. 10A9_DIV0425]OTP11322.1 AraC-like ligand binding domain-containing protein [Enterococcus sp. 10A9_DIV0425]THE13721.1 AraC family transcriptional regulator [Enterococcus hirae]